MGVASKLLRASKNVLTSRLKCFVKQKNVSFAETGSICQWVFGGLVRKNVLIFLDTIIPPNVSSKSGCNVSKSVESNGVISWSILGKKSGWCRFEVVSVSTIIEGSSANNFKYVS